MKKKELFLANTLLLILVAMTGLLTFNTLSNASLHFNAEAAKEALIPEEEQPKEEQFASACSSKEKLALTVKKDRHLMQLQKYQDLCNSYATNRLMIFTAFPANKSAAKEEAIGMATKLKQFKENGISPLVIVEPYAGDEAMDYKAFLNGNYDWSLDYYFSQLKQAGITDDMMGTWIPFPESNTPSWNNKDTEPRDFALCVNRYLALLKKTFPQSKGGILLNATTYDPNDIEWNNGDYLSLIPYVQDIDPMLIDSFGIQGFPWVSAATTKRKEIFRAEEFLQPNLAIEAARELRVKDIWINTGSFATKYARDSEKTVQVTLNQRRSILNGILEETKKIQGIQLNEYRVSINLFSEDKSHVEEATDWSYFQNDDAKSLLREFLSKAEKADIPVSLYDMDRTVTGTPQNITPTLRPTVQPETLDLKQYKLFPTKKIASPSAKPTKKIDTDEPTPTTEP